MRTSPPRFFLRISTFVPSARASRTSASRVSASTARAFFFLPARALRERGDSRLDRAHREAPAHDLLRERLLVRGRREGEERARVAGRQRAGLERLAHGRRKLEEAKGVRDRRPVLADPFGDILLRQAEVLAQVPVRLRLLERGQVPALDVLDEREEEVVAVRDALAHEDGHLHEPACRAARTRRSPARIR